MSDANITETFSSIYVKDMRWILSRNYFTTPVWQGVRVEKTRNSQDAAGQPDEANGDASRALTHPRS